MASSPSHSPSPPNTKDPPDQTLEPPTSPSRPKIQIRSATDLQPPPGLEPQPEAPISTTTARPPFAPFFTLINDATTGIIHHPRNIHYLFSDDDPTLLTSACLSALDDSPSPTTSQSRKNKQAVITSSSSSSRSPSSSTNTKPEDRHDRDSDPENRILILDLDASGSSVVKAQSLSSSWQILSTSVMPAPTWAESPSPSEAQSSENAPNLMLRIVGTDGAGRDGSKGEVGAGKIEGDAFDALMREFDERMRVLRTVVEAGELGAEGDCEETKTEAEGLKQV